MKIVARINETLCVEKEVEFEFDPQGLALDDPELDDLIETRARELLYEQTVWDGHGSGWSGVYGEVDEFEWSAPNEDTN